MKQLMLLLFGAGVVTAGAQSPGGVKGTELWFQTLPVTADLQGTYRWMDLAGDSVKLRSLDRIGKPGSEYTQTRSFAPAFNFHPALYLSGGSYGKTASFKFSNFSQATVFSVFALPPESHDKDMLLYSLGGRKGGGSILSKDKAVRANGTEPLDYGKETGEDLVFSSSDRQSATDFQESSVRVLTYLKSDRPGTGLWGENSVSNLFVGGTYSASNPQFNTGYDETAFGNNRFDGYSPEVIIYGRYLTPAERRKVESYLAVKYGITLNNSYLDSEGNLIWDKDENQGYHHRVTAIGSDAASALYQPLSTTSCEEEPVYATLRANDTFHDGNSYAESSASRLLVMGREYGNPLPDKGYIFWGDDNGPLTTYTSPADTLWHIMHRTWTVRSNVPASADSTSVRWNGTGMTVTRKGFLDTIEQDSSAAEAFAVTPALPGREGAISFYCPLSHPTFDAGFTGSGGNTCEYGYRFDREGNVYAISGGQAGATAVATGVSGSAVSIRREDGQVYLRIDGIGSRMRTIPLPEASGSMSGLIRAVTSEEPLHIAAVRTGGIGDTGNMAELSHALTPDDEFSQYCRNRTLLLIDPSGEGRFDTEDMIAVKCSRPDLMRGKTVFHNLFWDLDSSGSDVFTFAYYDGLAADAVPTPSTCEDGKPRNDGSIDIDIRIGTPVYDYVLSADTVAGVPRDEIIASGKFTGEAHRIDGLAPGTYTLKVTQGGGNDIYGTGDPLYTTYVHDKRIFTSGEVSWTVTGTNSNYRLGVEPRISDDITQFGFDVRGDKAYMIIDGHTSLTQFIRIKEGDVLTLGLEGITVSYKLNGEVIRRFTQWNIRAWRLCIKFGIGETHITGLTVNGEPIPDFTHSGNVQVENPKTNTVFFTVHVGSECDPTLPNGTEKKEGSLIGWSDRPGNGEGNSQGNGSRDDSFQIKPDGTTGIFDVVLEQDRPGDVTLMVFDASGKLVHEQSMEGGTTKRSRFEAPAPGVYVVKAIGPDWEKTRKIIAK